MFEKEGFPDMFLPTAQEIHAFGYGLLQGLQFWKRTMVPYDGIDALPLSPEWRADIKAKYHYYYVGFDLPEVAALVLLLIWKGADLAPLLLQQVGMVV